MQNYEGPTCLIELDEELTAGVKTLSKRHGTTLFMTLLASWAVLLSRLSGQSEVVIGTLMANRTRAEVEPLIGFFVNTLALRVDLSAAPSVSQLLDQVRATAVLAQANQDLPFDRVVEAVNPPRSLAHIPIFQTLFIWQNLSESSQELPGLELHPVSKRFSLIELEEVSSGDVGFQPLESDLELSLQDDGPRITGYVSYASALFEESTIAGYLDHWRTLLRAMCADDAQSVARLPLLSQGQRCQLLAAAKAGEDLLPTPHLRELLDGLIEDVRGRVEMLLDDAPQGHAERDLHLHILDEHGELVPTWVVGEIHVGVTLRVFSQMDDALSIPDPFVNKPGARIYRTGHLGRWRSDGSIEWLGHADQQVEIRGYRIRLKEIESALLLLPEVRAAVVMAHDDQAASKRLVAYVVGHGDRHAEPRRLREALQCKLPQHMVPRHFVMLERLPLAPNGKVDTNALPPPEEDRSPTANIAARTRQRLADIWADVLGVEEVGLHDDFFDLGGYSVSVLVLQDCIRKAFGVELTVRTLFENTRLEQLAEQVNECLGVRFSSSSGTP